MTRSPRNYDPHTLKLLWGRAAGRCAMPDCRVELFVTEDDYDPVCIIGEMGHIAASSNSGPRAKEELSLRDRDKYENLILLCRNCHRKVDTLKRSFPVARLLDIKASHEAWVRIALPERGSTNLSWNVVRLQGAFPFDPTTISAALSPDQEASLTHIHVSATRDSWASIQEGLKTQIHALIESSDPVASRIAVFPLAPVSVCVYVGYLLTNRLNVRSFQYHRDEATWIWPKDPGSLTMPAVEEIAKPAIASADVVFLFELSAPIDAQSVLDSIGEPSAVYRCSIPDRSTGWLKSKTQLDELARRSREVFEAAAACYSRSSGWHILYAGPAPGGVVVGQQLNPTMIPRVQLYEFQRPRHIPSVIITPHDSALTRWAAPST